MKIPSPIFLENAQAFSAEDIIVVGLRESVDGTQVIAPMLDQETQKLLGKLAEAVEAVGSRDSAQLVGGSALGVRAILFTGFGSETPDLDSFRESAGYAAMKVKKTERLIFATASSERETKAVVEGALLGLHRIEKSDPPESAPVKKLAFLGQLPRAEEIQCRIAAESVWRVRDLVNTPPNLLTPKNFVERIIEMSKGTDVSTEVWDEKEILSNGLGGLHAVGQGSETPPRLMILRYNPKNADRHIALVGKGITFDSGGLSLKSPNAMVGMKYDMTGAALMAAATFGAAALSGRNSVTAFLCLAENMPSGSASRPNDVITIKNGKTVEILNTDAEGRLVMADGLSLASELNPDLIIDAATLTGAARIALGERYAGLMGSPEAVKEIERAATETGEKVWAMPLPHELRSLLQTEIADIANAKPGEVLGGMLLGGVFLKEFVTAEVPWAHLDIAGPANNSFGPFGYTPSGASGAIVRTVLNTLVHEG